MLVPRVKFLCNGIPTLRNMPTHNLWSVPPNELPKPWADKYSMVDSFVTRTGRSTSRFLTSPTASTARAMSAAVTRLLATLPSVRRFFQVMKLCSSLPMCKMRPFWLFQALNIGLAQPHSKWLRVSSISSYNLTYTCPVSMSIHLG